MAPQVNVAYPLFVRAIEQALIEVGDSRNGRGSN